MGGTQEELSELISEVEVYARRVDSEIADRENDFRSMCFWNIHNRAVVTQEILEFYARSWEGMEVPDGLTGEMTERIVTVTKDMFVDTVSSIEKASKDCVNVYRESGLKEKSMEGRNYLYLRNIIAASADLGYITEDSLGEWEDVLTMRNLVTHNNSVADRSKVYETDGIRISLRPGRMMKGPPDTFVVLTKKVTGMFYEWLSTVDGMFS